jgi:hypothetical protein
MADDHSQRQYRTNEFQRAPGRESANDPLAELARLIGQTDPFAEFGAKQAPSGAQTPPRQDARQSWAPQPQAMPQAMPGYEQSGASAHDPYPAQQGYEQAAPATYENDQYYANDGYADEQADYDDVPPRRPRRLGVIAVAAVIGLAVVGSAAAFGYRALFGSSGSSPPPVIKAETTPTKVVPPSKSDSQSNKLIYDRVGDRGANEKIVSRQEQPVDISKTAQPTAFPAAMSGGQPPATSASSSGAPSLDQPKKVHTIVIKPDQQQAAAEPAAPTGATNRAAAPAPAAAPPPAPRAAPPQRLASAPPVATADAEEAAPVARAPARQAPAPSPSRNAPLSLSPNAAAAPAPPPEPVRTAAAPPARSAAPAPVSATGQYAVQISSQRSEAEAQAAFRSLQAKYPTQLGGRQALIRRADLGSKGIYYRALVGPFANGSDATALCQSLKSAGGSCLIQKN